MSSPNRHLRRLWKLPRAMVKGFMLWAMRILMLSSRPRRLARSGFVLPTTTLLLLMVVLTASALTVRSFSRSQQTIAAREQKVIVNAATPAIDRAKAKLEYLFDIDDRLPPLPSSEELVALIADPAENLDGDTDTTTPDVDFGIGGLSEDFYTLPDETRIDINGDDVLDNAWTFRADINGDGIIGDGTDADGNGEVDDYEADELVAYSILIDDEATVPGGTDTKTISSNIDQDKAKSLVTRSGPFNTLEASSNCRAARAPGKGWQLVNQADSSAVQRNFQVDAFVVNRNPANRTVETLEFQQAREAYRGSKWGAWFRYDIEWHPGSEFNWNGAIHTEGSIFARNGVRSYMISSQNSCLYSQSASEISLGGDDDGTGDFQGQLVRGTIKNSNYDSNTDTPRFHIWQGDNTAPTINWTLSADTDSVDPVGGSTTPVGIGMDPVKLFTEDQSVHLDPDQNTWTRDPDWADEDVFTGRRVFNESQTPPFVDDFYRADDRWGPKPRYSTRRVTHDMIHEGKKTGEDIGNDATYADLVDPENGLDGYWERQAVGTGLRLIVGQRLELGNAFGWNFDPIETVSGGVHTAPASGDPLYPPTQAESPTVTTSPPVGGGPNEIRQRRSLRDNLAAVQAMAVYHYEGDPLNASVNNGQFPLACMALTAHPGTKSTIINSRTFGTYPASGNLKADFLNGYGTNGWEFEFPDAFDTESEFANQIADDEPLGIALRNLAHFAGDPHGGAPSFPPEQDLADGVSNSSDAESSVGETTHPYEKLSMWGDFSLLRHIFEDYLDNGVAYSALSYADKTTLHTAACTLGLLAYNMQSEIEEYQALDGNSFSSLQNVTTRAGGLINRIIDYMASTSGNPANPSGAALGQTLLDRGLDRSSWLTACPSYTAATFKASSGQGTCGVADYFATYTLDDWIAVLPYASGGISAADIESLVDVATRVNQLNSIIRDRDLGFREGETLKDPGYDFGNRVTWDSSTLFTQVVSIQGSNSYSFKTNCDPNIFRNVAANGNGGDDDVVAGGLIACSERNVMPVRYPSLYYLFPLVDHDHDGEDYHAQPGGSVAVTQDDEEYIADDYINTVNPSTGTNAVLYQVVGSDDIEGVNEIALVPRYPSATPPAGFAAWQLPYASGTEDLTDPDDPDQTFTVMDPDGNPVNAAFLDKGMYDGRENLNVRVLDIDISQLVTDTNDSDTWLAANQENNGEGILYAFREDAVREDAIVRPRLAEWTECNTLDTLTNAGGTTADCQMDAFDPHDPPLNADNAISPKPIDFYTDPDHRANGFRLRNGEDFSDDLAREVGMTLVTDNPVYIQGNFNLHSTDGTADNIIEEFTQTLYNGNVSYGLPFYNGRTTLNTDDFANLSDDHWRPVEILTDALTILSGEFRDGAVEDTFLRTATGSNGTGVSSYQNQNRPQDIDCSSAYSCLTYFVKEDGTFSSTSAPDANTTLDVPVWVDRNGVYRRRGGDDTTNDYDCSVSGLFNNNLGCVVHYIHYRRASDNDPTNLEERRKKQIQADDTYVNAVFVSNILPSRANQGYGGFQNYPRLLEYWNNRDLVISGAFLQFGFSNTATGPYDPDAWEPTQSPVDKEWNVYYREPTRKWGYDVALQYVPPAPVSRRFVTIGAPRSEFYRELPADDPYMNLLRCAEVNGERLDPLADDTLCGFRD